MKGFYMPKAIPMYQLPTSPEFEELKECINKIRSVEKYQINDDKIKNELLKIFKIYIDIIEVEKQKRNQFLNRVRSLLSSKKQDNSFYENIHQNFLKQNCKAISIKLFKPYYMFEEIKNTLSRYKGKIEESYLEPLCKSNEEMMLKFGEFLDKNLNFLNELVILNEIFNKRQENIDLKDTLILQQNINSIKTQVEFNHTISNAKKLYTQYLVVLNNLIIWIKTYLSQINQDFDQFFEKQKNLYLFEQKSTIQLNPVSHNQFSTDQVYSSMSVSTNAYSKRDAQTMNNSTNLTTFKDIIAWIDPQINAAHNFEDKRKLFKEFQLQEIQTFQSFEQFMNFLEQKKKLTEPSNEFLSNQSRRLQNKMFQADYDFQKILQKQGSLVSFEAYEDTSSVSSNDLNQSYMIKSKICQEFHEECIKPPSISIYLIMSGKMALQVRDKLPSDIKSFCIYCQDKGTYVQYFSSDERVSIISSNFISVIDKLRSEICNEKIIYNCLTTDLKNIFKKSNPLMYLSLSNYCAKSVQTKKSEEIAQIIENIKQCFDKESKLQKLSGEKLITISNLIQDQFASVEKVISLYTKNNTFYQFINFLLSRCNENVLESSSYIIQTLRYALSVYQDNRIHLFKDPKFKLYRGLDVDPKKFKEDFPIKSKIVTLVFSSSSLEKNIAKNYAKGKLILEISFNILNLEDFEKCRPKYISEHSIYKDEEEVLFNCFSCFYVKKYEEEGIYTIAQLEFIENPIE